ncbi:hypothetical protein ACMFMG_004093 [Clarireedia jacksonii]
MCTGATAATAATAAHGTSPVTMSIHGGQRWPRGTRMHIATAHANTIAGANGDESDENDGSDDSALEPWSSMTQCPLYLSVPWSKWLVL